MPASVVPGCGCGVEAGPFKTSSRGEAHDLWAHAPGRSRTGLRFCEPCIANAEATGAGPGWGYWQLPPPLSVRGTVSVGHFSVQVLPPLQLTLHLPLGQVTLHVALSLQDTLPLSASVRSQDELMQLMLPLSPVVSVHVLLLQSMLPLFPVVSVHVLPFLHVVLHEPAHVPIQVLPCSQLNEQLPPWALQPVPFQVQLLCAAHAQALPVQVQPGPGQPPDTGSAPQPIKKLAPARAMPTEKTVECSEENNMGSS